jgi:hypothetical protein
VGDGAASKGGGTTGQDCLDYMYITVFVRNAAILTQLLTKAPKFRNGNKNFDFGFNCYF